MLRSRTLHKRDFFVIIVLALLVFDFWFRVTICFSNAICGDGAIHTYLAKQMIRNLRIYPYFPHWVAEVVGSEFVHYPVAYPQFFFMLLAGGYSIGGEIGVKFLNAIFGTLSVLIVFWLVKELINVEAALIAAFFMSCEETLYEAMSSFYMEGVLMFFCLSALLFYFLFIRRGGKKNFLLASLFLGLSMSTKQQGLLLFLAVGGFHVLRSVIVLNGNLRIKNWGRILKQSKILILPVLIAAPFFIYQLLTTGTLFYPPVPSFSRIIFKPKWTEDPAAINYINEVTATQDVWNLNWLLRWFPWFFNLYQEPFNILAGILLMFGITFILVEKKYAMASLFLLIITVHLIVFALVTPFPRYFMIVRILLNIIAAIGAYGAIRGMFNLNYIKIHLNSRDVAISCRRYLKYLMIFTFVLVFVGAPNYLRLNNVFSGFYGASDRTTGGCWPDRVAKIKQAAEWLKSRTSETDVILAGRLDEVLLYLDRKVVWITSLGGHNLPKVFSSMTVSEALSYLLEYRVTYIWIDQLQFSSQYAEWIPQHGLMDQIDISPFFHKEYQNDLVRIYRVCYPSEDSANLAKRHYYCNLLGDYDDLYDASPIKLYPSTHWEMGHGYREALPNNMTYAVIQVIPEELNVTNYFSQMPVRIVLFYNDSFKGNIPIQIRNSTIPELFPTVSEVEGTADYQIKYHVIELDRVYVDDSEVLIRFNLKNEPFRLHSILFFPQNLTEQERSELDSIVSHLVSPKIE